MRQSCQCIKAVNAPKLLMRQSCHASMRQCVNTVPRQCVNWYLPFSHQCNNPILGQHTINPSTFFSASTFFSWYNFFNIKCTDCETTRKKIHFVCFLKPGENLYNLYCTYFNFASWTHQYFRIGVNAPFFFLLPKYMQHIRVEDDYSIVPDHILLDDSIITGINHILVTICTAVPDIISC